MIHKLTCFHQLIFLTFILNLLPCFAKVANAEITLTAPEKVARGDAFIAQINSTEPTDYFIIKWNGKVIQIPPDNNLATFHNNNFHAKVLLPVYIDDKSTKRELSAQSIHASKASAQSARKTITIYEKMRPVQKLTVDKKFVSPPPDQQARIKEDRKKVQQALSQKLPGRLWDIPLERPVPGSVSSLFGLKRVFNGQPRGIHKGLDLRGAEGTPIKACADGKVVLVDNLYFSGNTVYVNHGDGVFSAYLHMSKPLVQPGETIVRGQTIGLVGSTGRVTGPHLHLSIFAQGQSIDPLPLLETSELQHKSSKSGNKKPN